jgi:hypothetical protein
VLIVGEKLYPLLSISPVESAAAKTTLNTLPRSEPVNAPLSVAETPELVKITVWFAQSAPVFASFNVHVVGVL